MPTYLLASSARVDGARYERGAELPDHEQTRTLLERGYATTDRDDLAKPFEVPTMVGTQSKASERSTVLVSDSAGVHRETVTTSGDGPRVTARDDATAEAAAEVKATGTRRK